MSISVAIDIPAMSRCISGDPSPPRSTARSRSPPTGFPARRGRCAKGSSDSRSCKPFRWRMGSTAPFRAGLGNLLECHAVAHHAGDDQVRVVQGRAVGVGDRVAQLAALPARKGIIREPNAPTMRPDVLYVEWNGPVATFGTPSSPSSLSAPDHRLSAAAAIPSMLHSVSIAVPVPSEPRIVPVSPTPDFFNSTDQFRN